MPAQLIELVAKDQTLHVDPLTVVAMNLGNRLKDKAKLPEHYGELSDYYLNVFVLHDKEYLEPGEKIILDRDNLPKYNKPLCFSLQYDNEQDAINARNLIVKERHDALHDVIHRVRKLHDSINRVRQQTEN